LSDIEPSPEARLEQELRQSQEEREDDLNLPFQLGLHLLDSFNCDNHAPSYEQHQQLEEEENHWSLDDFVRAIRQLPNTLNSANILPHNSGYRSRSYDWPRLFEGLIRDDEGENGSANNNDLDPVCQINKNGH
jgi:hypothetical protein